MTAPARECQPATSGLPGPCVICGDTNYNLSCGGPTICPKCDCGHFDAATVEKQARYIATLQARVEELTKALRKIAGHDEYGPHDHAAAAAYRREEGAWTTAEYLADRALAIPLERSGGAT